MHAIEKLLQRAGSDWRVAVAAVAALMVLVAWVAFIAYAAIANGVMAGVGVLVTWPILLAGLFIVLTPLSIAGRYAAPRVRRLRSGQLTPAVAGAQDEPRTITTNTFPC